MRREHHDRDRLRGHEQRVGGVAQRPEQVHGHRERHAGERRRSQARAAPPRASRRRCPSAATSRRAARRRSRPARRASGRPPSRARPRPARRARTARAASAARAAYLIRPSASSARALELRRTPGSVTSRGRGERPRRSRPPRGPGRGESTATRSARKSASSTSWVTSSTVRGSCASASASQRCIDARVIESSAPNGSSRSSTGRPGRSVRRNATRWRIPPDSSAGRARSNSARPKRSNSGSARRRASARGTPWHSSASAAFAERVAPRQQEVALGHVGAAPGAPRRRWRPARSRCRHPAPAGRPPARAAWTCRSRRGRRQPPPRPARTREVDALEGGDRCGVPPRHIPERKRLRHGSLGLSLHRSLRGHYPTGSKGQRRASLGAISARSREPPWLGRASLSRRRRAVRPGRSRTPRAASWSSTRRRRRRTARRRTSPSRRSSSRAAARG